MDILKKELAPLSTNVWQEIETRAAEVLLSRLSARKAIHVDGTERLVIHQYIRRTTRSLR